MFGDFLKGKQGLGQGKHGLGLTWVVFCWRGPKFGGAFKGNQKGEPLHPFGGPKVLRKDTRFAFLGPGNGSLPQNYGRTPPFFRVVLSGPGA